jgi:hypothetical protein
MLLLQFFILHFSFFIEFCEAKFRWASRFAGAACLRFAPHLWVPLASGYPLHHPRRKRRRWFRYYPSRLGAQVIAN